MTSRKLSPPVLCHHLVRAHLVMLLTKAGHNDMENQLLPMQQIATLHAPGRFKGTKNFYSLTTAVSQEFFMSTMVSHRPRDPCSGFSVGFYFPGFVQESGIAIRLRRFELSFPSLRWIASHAVAIKLIQPTFD